MLRRVLRENGLTLVLMALFLLFMVGQILTGMREHNQSQSEHGQPQATLFQYFATGHFWEATAENWESEFLQMAMFVILTVSLRQKGSPESKGMEGEEPSDADPSLAKDDPNAPWPVRRGGVALFLYSHSLSIAFSLLFLISFALHAFGGAKAYASDQVEHGQPEPTLVDYVTSSTFWFESFQNWQSEFLSLAAMVYLSVFLRERGSAESKPVATPHGEQGE
jgi:hypothetical protein